MAGPKFPATRLSTVISITFSCGFLYGLFLVTCLYANRWLIFTDEGWKLRKRVHWLMVAITNLIGMLLVSDIAVIVHVAMAQMDFIDGGHKPMQWVAPAWAAIVKCTIANVIALLADIVLMYRLWFVSSKRMTLMWFPILLWFGGIVCTVLEIFLQVAHIHNPNFGPYEWATVDMNVGPGIVLIPFWLSTVVLNAYCTSFLIRKIWKASKGSGTDKSSTRQLQLLVRILMESGILYLLVGLAHFFVWFGRDPFAIAVLGTVNTTVIAIAFNLVLIRTAQNKAEDNPPEDSSGAVTTIRFNTKSGVDVQTTHGTDAESYGTDETRINFAKNG